MSSDATRVFAQPAKNAFLAGAVAVLTIVALAASTSSSNAPLARAQAAAIAVVSFALTWRVVRIALVSSADRLIVRGLVRTRSFDARDISRFEVAVPYGTFAGNGIRVHLRDGRIVSTGVFATTPVYSAGGEQQVGELNDWLRDPASGGTGGAPMRGPLWWVLASVTIVLHLAVATLVIALLVDPSALG